MGSGEREEKESIGEWVYSEKNNNLSQELSKDPQSERSSARDKYMMTDCWLPSSSHLAYLLSERIKNSRDRGSSVKSNESEGSGSRVISFTQWKSVWIK